MKNSDFSSTSASFAPTNAQRANELIARYRKAVVEGLCSDDSSGIVTAQSELFNALCAMTEAAPVGEQTVTPLVWSEEQQPQEDCRYNHVTAETTFGRILISWKGWKEYPGFTIDEHPSDENYFTGDSLELAKQKAEDLYAAAVLRTLAASPAPAQLVAGQGAGQRATTLEAWLETTMKERDQYHDMADQLAAEIAVITGEEIGEHSSSNNPWSKALIAGMDYRLRGIVAEHCVPVALAQEVKPRDKEMTHAAGEKFNNFFHKCRAEVSMDWWQRIWRMGAEWALQSGGSLEVVRPTLAKDDLERAFDHLSKLKRDLLETDDQSEAKQKLLDLLEDEAPAAPTQSAKEGEAWKHWCETCEGTGTIDETLGGEHFSDPAATCPDCDGQGYWVKASAPQQSAPTQSDAAPVGGVVRLPAYGTLPWSMVRAYVQAAVGGGLAPAVDPQIYTGHQMVGINYNSLNRIMSALAAAPHQAALTDEQLADAVPQDATVLVLEGGQRKVCMTRAQLRQFFTNALVDAPHPQAAQAQVEALRAFVAVPPLAYGAFGTRDVDIARWHEAHRAASAALASSTPTDSGDAS